jgi:hypothetical protein
MARRLRFKPHVARHVCATGRKRSPPLISQQESNEGTPASEKTEVRVLFDDRNLYIGIHAFDSDPANINARELVRDASFSNDDKVEILLDTNHDRNAFRFAVNPLGTQQDALITDEGRDLNLSWDAPWISSGKIDDPGWTVEIALPLTTLRFKEGNATWDSIPRASFDARTRKTYGPVGNVRLGLNVYHKQANWWAWEKSSVAGYTRLSPYVTGGWREGVPQIGRPGFDTGIQGKAGSCEDRHHSVSYFRVHGESRYRRG